MQSIKNIFSTLFILLALSTTALAGKDPVYTSYFSNNGADGYDVTAYFSENKAVKGNKEFSTTFMGADWLFVSQANLDKFNADPVAYAPQYGGYCAYAAAIDTFASGDPEQWSIYEGKLYLNYDTSIKQKWDGNKDGFVADANANWPGLLAR